MENLEQVIKDYISINSDSGNKMRWTHERKLLTDKASTMEVLSISELLLYAETERIAKPSVYFFIELLVKIGIVKIQERYVWNKEEK